MKLQTLSRLVGAKGLVRGWRAGLLPLALLVTGLSSRAEAAGSTASIDVAQFAPDSSLTQYSVYATDSINLPNQSGTANGGYFGSGGGISLANNMKMRSDLYTAGRNFSLGDGSGADSGKFVVTGNFDIGNNARFDSVLQVGGKINTNGNDVIFNKNIYAKKLSVNGDRTDFYGSINVTDTFWANSSKTILHGAAVNMAGPTGTVLNPPSGMTPNYGVAIVPPLGSPLIRLPQALPGYNVVGLDLAGNPTRQDFNVGNNGHSVTLKNTATGASAQNVFNCAENFKIFGAAVAAASCHGDTLQPGYYGNLTFNSANGEVLLLGEGFYYFDKISLGSSGKIVASQPNGKRTFVYSQQDMVAQGSNSLISPEGAINATKYGAGTGSFLGGTMMLLGGANITIPNDNTIWATISAPRGDVHLGSQVKVFGQVFAKRVIGDNNIDFGEGAYIPFDPKTPRIRISIASTGIAVPEADFTYYAKLTLSKANAFPVSFSYVISDTMITKVDSLHHAIGDVNYVSKSTPSIVTIAAGDTSVLVPFTVKWDHVYTGDNNFYLHFSVPQNGVFELGTGVVGDSSNVFALVTILDKDRAPTLRISDVSAMEGNSGTTDFKFVVSFADSATGGAYAGTVNRDITYTWSTVAGTASSATGDYAAVTKATGKIAKGKTTDTIVVKVNGDLRYEPTEYFKVVIDSASLVGQAAIADAAKKKLVGIGTIVNDDNFPKLMIDSAGFKEGDADSVRKLVVYLVDPVTKAKLDVTSAPEVPVKYSWSTSDNTAGHSLTGTIPDTDYVEVPSSARSIAANKWTDTIQVTTKGDARFEANETFRITLAPGDSAWKKDGNTVALDTIRNDDNQPIVKVRDSSVVEGNTGTTTKLYFKVGLYNQGTRLPITTTDAPTTDVTFDWKTISGTATDAGTYKDYGAVTAGKGTITAGNVETTLSVDVYGDKRYELDEQFNVAITNLTNAAPYPLNDTVATMTIVNDDALPQLKLVSDSSRTEGKSGDRNMATFTLSLTDVAGNALSVADGPEVPVAFRWQTTDGTAKSSGTEIADTDYVAVSSYPDMIQVGAVSKTLAVQLKGDLIDEGDEAFIVSANAVSGATGMVSANGIIKDDDGPPEIRLVGMVAPEGDVGTTMFRTSVSLTSASALPVTFDWSTLPISGGATEDVDYQKGAGSITIKPGRTDTFLTVLVNGDKILEDNEPFAVKFTNPKNATFAGGNDIAVDTILNDDAKPFIQVKSLDNAKEGNTTDTALYFEVSLVDSTGALATPSLLPVTYNWSTVDSVDNVKWTGASSTDNDFVQMSNAARTIVNKVKDTLRVVVKADTKYEYDESFRVVLNNVKGADTNGVAVNAKDKGITTAVGTILNDDDMPSLAATGDSVQEPAKATDANSSLVFGVHLSAISGVPVTVNYGTQQGSATPDDATGKYDYADATGSVTFAPGDTVKTVAVKVHGDDIYEGTTPETVNFTVTSTSNATLAPGSAIGYIRDNDDDPILHIDTAQASEGGQLVFTASLRDKAGKAIKSGLPVSFAWKTVDGTATAGDYTAIASQTNSIPAGTNSVQITVTTLADSIANEGTETLFIQPVSVAAVVNAVIGDTGLGKILDITPKPQVSIFDTIVSEAAGSAIFRIHLDRPSATPLELTWGTLRAKDTLPVERQARDTGSNANYTAKTNVPLTIQVGTTDTFVTVPVLNNLVDEPDTLWYWTKLVKKTAGDASFSFKDSLAVGGILDNDAPPTISITDTAVNEPLNQASAPTKARFYVKLSAPSAYEVTGSWKTFDGTATSTSSATASADFTAAQGGFKIPAGQLVDSIFVDVLGDTLDEPDETFKVRLLTSVNAPVSAIGSVGIGTILDEDPLPSIFVRDTALNEPVNGTNKTYKLFAYLNRRSAKTVTVAWTTADNGGAQTATAGADYVAASGTLTFAPGDTVKTMEVTILGDGLTLEGNELFKISLSSLVNVQAGRVEAIDTIIDADGKPFATIDSVSIVEPKADSTVYFKVHLDKLSAMDVSIGYATANITAAAGSDYVAAAGTLVIKAGSLMDSIAVVIKADAVHEDTETFQVKLLTSITASFSEKIGLGTIIDNDSMPVVSVGDASKLEPAAMGASDTMTFHIKLSAPSGLPVTVKWGTKAGTAQDTAKPYDYQDTGNTVVFLPGQTDTTISVRIFGDSLYEGPETFSVVLSGRDGALFANNDSSAVGTILDNDSAPRIAIDDQTVREGDTAHFTVRLDRESGLPVSFHWSTVAGTATEGLDYKASSGDVTIPAGQLTAKLAVPSLTDNVSGEGAETFQVVLTAIQAATKLKDTGLGTILDTNALPGLVIDSVLKVQEKDTVVTFAVKVVGAPGAVPLHIHYTTHEGTAKAGLRYADTSGTLVLPALATSGKIAVHILDDSIREPQEEFYTVVLDQADSATLLRPIGLGSVIDGGDYPTLRIANSDTVYEGDAAFFPLTLSNVSKDTIRVWWQTKDDPDANIGAREGKDYSKSNGVVVFLPGRKTASLSVGTLTDNIWEPTELFHVVIDSVRGVLDGAKAASVPEPSATGWIKELGEVPTVIYLSPDTSVHESHADSIPVRLGLSRPASVNISVTVPAPSGTATFGTANKWPTDYTVSGYDPSTGTVTFKAGDTVASFAVRVTKDGVDEYDEIANFGLLTSQPIRIGVKGSYALTILDDDSAPTVRFDTSYQEVTEGDSVVVKAHLSRPSAKDGEAWYRSTGTAKPGVDDDRVPGAHLMFHFKAGDTTASVKIRTVDDNIHEGQENMVFRIDSLVNLTLDTLHQVDSVVVVDNDDLPFISFVVADTTVREDVGTVSLGLRLSNPSSTPITVLIDAKAGASTQGSLVPAILDSLARASDVELQDSARVKTRYSLVIPEGDTLANFTFKVLDDGRVEPTEGFSLKVSSKDAKPRDPVFLVVKILDNDLLPTVKITSPAEGAHLGKKDLNSSGKVPATWTVNKLVMAPFDTLLPEGPSTISKCYTDDWGNTGCDSVHVTLDTTPPTVVIDSICKGNVCLPAGPTMPWVNVPDVIVKWHVVDGTVITNHSDKEHLTDTVNTPVRCAEDAVGNKGCGSSKVGLDTVPPSVNILTPPPGSHWAPGCLNVTYTTQDNDVVKLHDTLQCFPTIGKHTYTVCSEADRAGNVGCDTSTVFIDPMVPNSATYLDTDGDGRIDQVVVNFPAKWVGELPTADISYGTPGTNTVKGVKASYGTSSQAGSILVTGKDTLKDASGKPVRVVPGVAVLDAKGQQVVDANGAPVYQSSLGTPLLDAKGVQRLDANGVPLWSVSSSSSAVDSSVLVFKLTTPYPYGWTSSSVKDLGVLHAVSLVKDTTGAIVKQPYTAAFNINDGVAPAILRSEIHRTECYTCKDTTVIYPSEPLSFSKTKGTGIVQISTDQGLSWHDVTVDSLTPSGAIVVLTEPGAPGSPKPNVLIRLVDAVSDMKGNGATTGHQPSVLISGGPRPDLVEVKEPTGVLEIGASNASKNLKGSFAFLTSRKDTTNLTAYRPGEGYGTAAETQEVCPDVRQCSVTRLYINRPASVHMYVYDHIGTYITKTNFTVSKKDMEMMETDKLDRARLDVLWNLRNDQGRQVVSGVYLIRMVIRYNDANTANAPLENFVLKIGVHIND